MEEQPSQSIVETILELKGRAPFEPFRIVMTSGDKYLVKLESQLFYGYPRSDKYVFMRLNQIASIEQFNEISTMGKGASNGKPKKDGRRPQK